MVAEKIKNESLTAWVRPELKRIEAGSAEAQQLDGVPDGGNMPGMGRS